MCSLTRYENIGYFAELNLRCLWEERFLLSYNYMSLKLHDQRSRNLLLLPSDQNDFPKPLIVFLSESACSMSAKSSGQYRLRKPAF